MNAYREIDVLKEELNSLRDKQSDKVVRAFEIEYTFESNKIEGNTLTLQETALVIEKGLTIGGKTLNEHLEAINHTYAIDFIKDIAQSKQEITERLICEIHELVLKTIDDTNAGKYRSVSVMISGSKYIPPPPYELPKLMGELIDWYNTQKDGLHPIALSAQMHERLVTIHPFTYGNGRTSRLLMNLILLQNDYPIAILKGDAESRLKYYHALEIAQNENNKEVFERLIAECVRETMQRIIKIVRA